MGLWQACRQWKVWQQTQPQAAPASIGVNLSRVQMALAERLLDWAAKVLVEVGMPPNCLQLEVTEREVMRDPQAAHKLMNALRATGIKLAMDNFGTGASSLGCRYGQGYFFSRPVPADQVLAALPMCRVAA